MNTTHSARASDRLLEIFLGLFLLYLFLPLLVMVAATFNTSRFPTITPWRGTTLQWFSVLYNDSTMWLGLKNSFIVGFAVVLISVPIGVAAAMLINGLRSRARSFLYGLMVSPLLCPGVIIGISTLIFWDRLGVKGGLHLAAIGQSSYIIGYVMLMVLARLQRFDTSLEEAALDLGATHFQSFRRVLLPHLKPSILTGAVLAFFQSFENFNTTLFTRGTDTTLTIYVASKVRTGLTPAVNALGLILIAVTVAGAIGYEVLRRREARRQREASRAAARSELLELKLKATTA